MGCDSPLLDMLSQRLEAICLECFHLDFAPSRGMFLPFWSSMKSFIDLNRLVLISCPVQICIHHLGLQLDLFNIIAPFSPSLSNLYPRAKIRLSSQ